MSDDTTFCGVPLDEAVRAEVRPATRWERVRLWLRRWVRV